jgi:hypothetical protein
VILVSLLPFGLWAAITGAVSLSPKRAMKLRRQSYEKLRMLESSRALNQSPSADQPDRI